jgi:hypothetical protein
MRANLWANNSTCFLRGLEEPQQGRGLPPATKIGYLFIVSTARHCSTCAPPVLVRSLRRLSRGRGNSPALTSAVGVPATRRAQISSAIRIFFLPLLFHVVFPWTPRRWSAPAPERGQARRKAPTAKLPGPLPPITPQMSSHRRHISSSVMIWCLQFNKSGVRFVH